MSKDRKNRHFPNIKNISVVAFDVGDTLFATTSIMQSALRRTASLMKSERLIEDPAQFCRVYQEIDRQVVGPAVNHLFSGLEIVERVWEKLRLKPSPFSMGTFLKVYRDLVRKSLCRDASLAAAFRQMQRSGCRIAVLTDGSTEEQLEQLVRLGVAQYLDLVVTSEQVGVEKPGRKMFDSLFAALAVTAGECVMVGNDVERDMRGAKTLGMHTILVTAYTHHPPRPKPASADFVVRDVKSAVRILLDR